MVCTNVNDVDQASQQRRGELQTYGAKPIAGTSQCCNGTTLLQSGPALGLVTYENHTLH